MAGEHPRRLLASGRPDVLRPTTPSSASLRPLAARIWSGHRLFIIVLTPAVLLRVDAELGYRWQAWFNDSFEYIQNTIHFGLDPTRVSGYSVWLKILQPFHSYALITILQHLMGLAVAAMVYALARHRYQAPAWLATMAAVPVLYDGFEIQLEHLILSDAMFLFVLMLATTLLLWDPAGPSTGRCAAIGALLGLGAVLRSVGLPLLAVFAVFMIIRRFGWRQIAATIVVCLIPVFGYAGAFDLEHGQFAMSNATGSGCAPPSRLLSGRSRRPTSGRCSRRSTGCRRRSSLRCRISMRKTSRSAPSRRSRWITSGPSGPTPGWCSAGSGSFSRRRRPTMSTCSATIRCRSPAGIRPASGATALSRPRTCGATR